CRHSGQADGTTPGGWRPVPFLAYHSSKRLALYDSATLCTLSKSASEIINAFLTYDRLLFRIALNSSEDFSDCGQKNDTALMLCRFDNESQIKNVSFLKWMPAGLS
ncbi:MAG: hypothetical protein II672_03230, partial [Oscillospiraceae bacterium]|nr:hypothetical protein [Oscillospiraceae bacterium]